MRKTGIICMILGAALILSALLLIVYNNLAEQRAAEAAQSLLPTLRSMIDERLHACVRALAEIACARGQSLAQLAMQWTLREDVVTSALIGASRPEQVKENAAALAFPKLTDEEIAQITAILDRYDAA